MKSLQTICLAVALLSAPTALLARGGKTPEPEALPPGAVYRYINAEGSMVMTHALPEEGIYAGYDIIDAQGRVIQQVEAAPSPAEQETLRAQRDQAREAELQSRRDRELLRMYAVPDDAERARDRQLAALQLNIDYARGNIAQLRSRLDTEISNAARIERSGRDVPEATAVVIERYGRQISDLEQEILQHEADMEQVRENFTPIIERLRQITK
ncbi:hypothetical protein [Alcanivorax limicola]|uniref:hypothetical protein n=1 Tax=Alcanivorax limicola TaxID=2874102 RepID=UPI001CBD1311|nr:hypothetical protein [Alcanivorax limicola]